MARQSGAMGHQIARSDARRDALVRQPEPGDVAAQRHVPLQAALVDQGAHGESSEGLGRRADGQDGVGGHGGFLLQIPVAVALGQDNLVVDDDGHGRAWNVQALQPPGDDLVECGQRGAGLGGGAAGTQQPEGKGLPALDEAAAEFGPVGGEASLEGRLTGNAGNGKGHFAATDSDGRQRQVLGALGRDGNVALPGAVGLQAEIAVDLELLAGELDGTGPMPLQQCSHFAIEGGWKQSQKKA
jgi:hypothetical protein